MVGRIRVHSKQIFAFGRVQLFNFFDRDDFDPRWIKMVQNDCTVLIHRGRRDSLLRPIKWCPQ